LRAAGDRGFVPLVGIYYRKRLYQQRESRRQILRVFDQTQTVTGNQEMARIAAANG
jgi:hypothetical protein